MAYDDLSYPRSRGLGLIDEEEEEELRRRAMQIGALQPTAAMAPPAASMPPSRPTMAALLPQGDPELDGRWRDAENAAIDRSGLGGEQSYGVGEGIRDFAPMAIGFGLDALLNKGRGLGTLAAGGMQALSSENSRRDRASQTAAQQALAIRRQREAGGDRNIQAQHAALRGEGMDLERQKLELERQKMGAKDPESAARANYLESQAYANWSKDPNALSPEQQAMNEDRDLARQQQRELADAARLDRVDARADSAAYRTEMAAGRQEAARARAAAGQEKTDAAAANKFLDKTQEERAQARSIQSVEPIVDNPKYAKDLPGVGVADSNLPAWLMHPIDAGARQDAETVKQQTGEAYAYFRHKLTGAAFGKLEDADYKAMKGLNGTEEEWRNAMRHWKASVQREIKGRAAVAPGPSREALEAQGLGQWTYGNEPPPPPAADDELPPDTVTGPVGGRPLPTRLGAGGRPGLDDLSGLQNEQLPVTGGRGVRATPDFPGGSYRAGNGRAQAAGQQPMTSGTVNAPPEMPMAVDRGDGSFDLDGETYTADEIAKLRRKGLIQ